MTIDTELTNLDWDIEERVEDVFVAYLTRYVGRRALIIASRSVTEVTYPLVVVEILNSDNPDVNAATADFTGHRQMDVILNIVTEAVNYPDEEGEPEVYENAREIHRRLKHEVIRPVASAILAARLNDLEPEGIEFSLAHMTAQTRDEGEDTLITQQAVNVIVNPKER